MRPKGRKPFYLIFTNDPPAVDVIREDFVVTANREVGSVVTFNWKKTDDVLEPIEGKIHDKGTQKRLKTVHLDSNGNLCAEGGVGTRKQEIEKERMRQQNAMKLNLQADAEQLMENGPAVFCEQPPALVNRRPTKRSAEEIASLTAKAMNLPCLKNGPGKVQLLKGKGVYFPNPLHLSLLRMHWWKTPKRHFNEIVKKIARPLFVRKGYSATGTRGCAPFPVDIMGAVFSYVNEVKVLHGGAREDFDPQLLVEHLFTNFHPEPEPDDDMEAVPAPLQDNIQAPLPDNVPAPLPDNVPAPLPDNVPAPQPENVPAPLPDNVPAPQPENVPAPLPAHLIPLPAAPGIVEAAPVLRTADNGQGPMGHTETVQNEESDDSLMSTQSDLIYEVHEVSSDRSQSPHFFDLKTANHSQQLASDHLYAGPYRSERTLPYSEL